MPRNSEALKITEAFGDGANNAQELPDDFRLNGWDVRYSQKGGLLGPEGAYWTQLSKEISAFCVEVNTQGIPPEWSPHLNYEHVAFVRGTDGNIYRSLDDSGPDTFDATNPILANNTKWRLL